MGTLPYSRIWTPVFPCAGVPAHMSLVSSCAQQDVWPALGSTCGLLRPCPDQFCKFRGGRRSPEIPFPRTGGSLLAWEGLGPGLAPTLGPVGLAFPATSPPSPPARQRPERSWWGFPSFLLLGPRGSLWAFWREPMQLRNFGQWRCPFPLKGTSGATSSAIPHWWL